MASLDSRKTVNPSLAPTHTDAAAGAMGVAQIQPADRWHSHGDRSIYKYSHWLLESEREEQQQNSKCDVREDGAVYRYQIGSRYELESVMEEGLAEMIEPSAR